jgi:hypothetical protein
VPDEEVPRPAARGRDDERKPVEEFEEVEEFEKRPARRDLRRDDYEEEDDDFEDRPVRRRRREDDRPRRFRPKKKSGNTGLIIGLAIGGAVFLLMICGGVAFWLFIRSEANPLLTEENIKKIQPGLTLAEVEQILGAGRVATEDDMRQANTMMKGIGPKVQFRPGTTKYRWRNGNTWLFVDVDNNTKKVVGVASMSSS